MFRDSGKLLRVLRFATDTWECWVCTTTRDFWQQTHLAPDTRQNTYEKTSGNHGDNCVSDKAHVFARCYWRNYNKAFFFLSSYSFQILHQCSSFQTLNLTLVVEIVGKKVPRLPAGSTEKGRKLGWEASDGLAINPSVFNFYRIIDIHAVC